MYPHAGIVGGLQVGLNVADRINDRPGGFAAAAEEVEIPTGSVCKNWRESWTCTPS
jgi:hypothetical protein